MILKKTALVTGGAGGIGMACVRNLLESGAKVAVADVSDHALAAAEKELDGLGEYKCYRLDISMVDDIAPAVRKIREDMGEIEILVQTAGLLKSQSGLGMTEADWDQMMNINARGMFFVMQQVVEQSMKKTGGSIVNFASMAGIRGMRASMASPHYSASKGAVVAMTMQAATEWACFRVRCNAVAPGGVLTKAMVGMEFPDGSMDPIPLRRLSQPEDIANGVVFLASDKAAMITGQTLVIDGGSSIVGY
ncbi:MAG: SDR family oxidoreductase [Clostridiales bacterium]|nr:SDR family oxidoreductase [Clostridiales bacterium]